MKNKIKIVQNKRVRRAEFKTGGIAAVWENFRL